MNWIYDYMFYRISKWYRNRTSKDKLDSENAHIAVSISQGFLITDVMGMVLLVKYSKDIRVEIMDKLFPFYIILIILIIFFNYWRYRNKFDELHEKFKDENKTTYRFKTIIIILLFILPILFIPVFLNIYDYSK